MHRRGVGYVASLVDPDGELDAIYENESWEEIPVKAFSPNLEVRAGSRLEWACDYENTGSDDVYQGPRSTDEMCMLIGSFYPNDFSTAFCARPRAPFLNARWEIGQGEGSCADAFSCVLTASAENGSGGGATLGPSRQGLTTAITECLLATSPEVSGPVSDMLGCLAATPADGNPIADCQAEIDVCMEQ
jgi:hypothetical protein